MSSSCISDYPDLPMMDRNGPHFYSRDDESSSDLSSTGSSFYPGLSGASFPALRVHSGTSYLPEGPQNFQVPAVRSRTQNGFSNSFQSFATPRVSQSGPSPGSRSQMFDIPFPGTHHVATWISDVSLPIGSPSNGATSDYHDMPGSIDMSYSLSGTTLVSGHSSESNHNSPSDTTVTVCKNSPQHETEYHTYSKYEDGHTFHRSQSNGAHALTMTSDSTLNLLGHSEEETLFGSPIDMHNQSFYQDNVTVTQGLQIGDSTLTTSSTWDQESRVPSPVFNGSMWPNTFMNSPPESLHDFSINGLDSPTQYARNHDQPMDQNLNQTPGDFEYGPFVADGFSYDIYPDEHYPMEDDQKRRASEDTDSSGAAREHPLYQKATTGPDGFYHCPWEGSKDQPCNHKPEKLKCNYDKFVDSHLKPYRCKVHTCENARFSSTACLLRHEREAHAMHGHGEKPFLCTHSGCERGLPGNGFPRHWNLRDHMRRVHDTEPSAASSNKPAKLPRKRKNEALERGTNKRTPTSNSEPPQVVCLSPREQLQFRKKQIEEQLQQLGDDADPDDPTTKEKLRNAENTIKEMHHIVHAVPKVSRRTSQLSG